jgi:hypothetical protein
MQEQGFDPIVAAGMEDAAKQGERFLKRHYSAIAAARSRGRRRAAAAAAETGGEAAGEQHDPGENDEEEDDDHPIRDWMRFCQGYQGRFVDDVAVELPPLSSSSSSGGGGGGVFPGSAHQQTPDAVVVKQSPATGGSSGSHGGKKGGGRSGGGGRGGGGRGRGGGPAPPARHHHSSGDPATTTGGSDRGRDPALTGTTVWDGAVVLAQYFLARAATGAGGTWRPPAELRPDGGRRRHEEAEEEEEPPLIPWPRSRRRAPVVLELGAGTGLAGLAAAAAGGAASAVCMTDVPSVARPGGALAANARLNAATIARRGRAWRLREREQKVVMLMPTADGQEVIGDADEPAAEEEEVVVQPLRWGVGLDAQQDLRSLFPPFGLVAAGPAVAAAAPVPTGPPALGGGGSGGRRAGPDVVAGADLVYYSYSPETPHSRLLLQTIRLLLEGGESLDPPREEGEEEEAAGAPPPPPPPPQAMAVLALSLQHNAPEVARFLHWATSDFGMYVRQVPPTLLPAEYRTASVLLVEMWLRGGSAGEDDDGDEGGDGNE